MDKLIEELKNKTMELLDLSFIDPGEVTPETPLFGDDNSLGLDSIDALEIVIMLEKDYGVRIDNKELGRKVMVNFSTLAAYVKEHAGPPTD
jgi:acyl carrier protein